MRRRWKKIGDYICTHQVWVANAPADITQLWPQARQVVFVQILWEPRRPQAKPRKHEVHYYIIIGPAGQRRLTAQQAMKLIRGHWGIENRHFHVKDRTLREDDQRAKSGALILACLRSVTTTLLQSVSLTGRRRAYTPEKRRILNARPSRALRMVMKPIV